MIVYLFLVWVRFWCYRSEKCVGACMMECENWGFLVWVFGLRES